LSLSAPLGGPLLDHLIRPLQERRRDRQAERLGGLQVDHQVKLRDGVPSRVEIEKWRILPVGCSTTKRPSGKTAAGGMRHGEGYQEGGAAA
jgi:hypothetical protein